MNRLPANGERVVGPGRSGIGVVEKVKILKHLVLVRWSVRSTAWMPIEDLIPEEHIPTPKEIGRSLGEHIPTLAEIGRFGVSQRVPTPTEIASGLSDCIQTLRKSPAAKNRER